MTVVAAWIREVGETQELVFVSDSRLRWAGSWDSCPKIFLLPRSDALMAFAGDTLWAYPIIAQTINNITAFEPSRERRYDLLDAKGHALRVINDMVGQGDAIDGPDPPDETADFLFGGFSAREGRFRLWRFFFDGPAACFRAERIRPRRIGTVRFIGDVGPQASRRLYEQMDSLGKDNGPLDFEPLAVVRELLREASRDSTIGGPLQVAKAYRHMNTEAFAVRWSSEPGEVSARLSFLGRPLLEYEELGVPLLDPDRPRLSSPPVVGKSSSVGTRTSLRASPSYRLRTRTVSATGRKRTRRATHPSISTSGWTTRYGVGLSNLQLQANT